MTSVKHRRAAPPKRPKASDPVCRWNWVPPSREPKPAPTVVYYRHLANKLAWTTRELIAARAQLAAAHFSHVQLADARKLIDEQAERIVELQREVERSAQIMRPFQAEVVGLPMEEFVAA